MKLWSILLFLNIAFSISFAFGNQSKSESFLKPYIDELRHETPHENLKKISQQKEKDLITLHHGYGTWIRNKWLWGNRNVKLLSYFKEQGITHPDEMSRKLIEALWKDLKAYPLKEASTKNCQYKNWKLSKLEFSPFDPYLETVLGFSYGPEVKKFIPKLSGAISRYYYEGSPDNSKFTFFSTYYSQDLEAQKAFKHLQRKVKNKELQDILIKGKQVVWFAGRDITEDCFQTLKAQETSKFEMMK